MSDEEAKADGQVAEKQAPPARQEPIAGSSREAAAREDREDSTMADTDQSQGKDTKLPTVQVATDHEQITKLTKDALKKSGEQIILVPVDFSDHSEAALVRAAKFAEMMPATLIVLHVVHDPGEMPGYYSKLMKKKRVARIQDMAAEAFEDFMAHMLKAHPHLKPLRKAETLLVIGLPVTRILQVVDKLNPVMVVMGSQGRTGLKHILLGSKAEQVVQLCPVPVTIVKTKK